jgi:3-dehydroquinate synthase
MRETVNIQVDLGARSYPITIGAGILGSIGARVASLGGSHRVGVVTDSTVRGLYADDVLRSLRAASLDPALVEVADGEESKSLASLSFLYDRFLEAGLDRRSTVIALGGGVIGDLAGFAAATFLRGVPFIQVPTTLLAQVDSSVGGKTGVNLPQGKNLVGAFYQPRLVWIDVLTLTTLPQRQVRAGLAEVIKYGAILSAELFEYLERSLDRLLGLEDEALVNVVGDCCRLKASVVSEDERESGLRAILNFGHTLGHALEQMTDYRRYLHGEAVAVGMVFAARLSAERGLCPVDVATRIERLVERAGLPSRLPGGLSADSLLRAVGADKKIQDGKVRFVGLQSIGKTCFVDLAGAEILHHAEAASVAA